MGGGRVGCLHAPTASTLVKGAVGPIIYWYNNNNNNIGDTHNAIPFRHIIVNPKRSIATETTYMQLLVPQSHVI
jgi:hypothetical protein